MERLKILVVDDESRMRKLVRDFLVREDYEVLEAGDGEEALDIFYKEKNIALIILDIMMPKINGWDVCREVRETSKVPIIMLTAKSDESDELTGFELGVDEYISKPFSPKILVARVNVPASTSFCSTSSSFCTSYMCRPVVGSSRIYIVRPVARRASSVASFTRWASPPESVVELWPSFT